MTIESAGKIQKKNKVEKHVCSETASFDFNLVIMVIEMCLEGLDLRFTFLTTPGWINIWQFVVVGLQGQKKIREVG